MMRRLIVLIGPLAMLAVGAELRVGAARLEITPKPDAALPMAGYGPRTAGHSGIHDPLYVRALVAGDGTRLAAVVGCDVLWMTDELWERASGRIAKEAGIPREFVLLAASHTHGAPALGPVKEEFEERWRPWMQHLEDRIVSAVLEAKAAIEPARLGWATGKAYVNVNRRARHANGGWALGVNPEGPSDKTVAVARFENAAGKPIAILFNYPVHGTVMGPRNLEITGDLPGAAARFVEQHYGDPVVALWTAGASGDQNAIYGPGTEFGHVAILGRILGEETVRVAEGVRTSPHAAIRAAQRVVTCPGKVSGPPKDQVQPADAAPVAIRVSVLQIGHLALAGISGEALTEIGERIKRESPFARTMVVTHCNGSSGYIPGDAAYAQNSYEIWISRLKPGCAEKAIAAATLDLLEQFQ